VQTQENNSDAIVGTPSDSLEFLAFFLGDQEYGIDIQKVNELRRYEKVTQIANAPIFINGVINLRGTIVPIVDLRIKFNLGVPSYNDFAVIIILNISNRVIGVIVDSVSDVVMLTPDRIKPMPMVDTAFETDFLRGIGTTEQGMLILLDIERLMSSTEMGSAENMSA